MLLAQYPAQPRTFQETLGETGNLKKEFTIDDSEPLARRVIESKIVESKFG
ncbi:hypothetical protein [Leptothoe spongobia]|uniref:Uncharacterized protein n=1 Tax=Leptothoe spongobia TAU-MAC 1115 TaxID=1967444 RepID=A0A947DIF8_9CYAN|nr:hypothetical protein [Leptothoe spongobia]MBT9317268.1 hypothetical protein [Leptothoe spongobia TAU-MAC 1115]